MNKKIASAWKIGEDNNLVDCFSVKAEVLHDSFSGRLKQYKIQCIRKA